MHQRNREKFKADYLDEAVLDWIIEQHNANKKNAIAFIEGLGPSGLYAALRLFMAGFDVVGVEKRAEDAYVRARHTQLDIKWAVQLAWFLGTALHRHTVQQRTGDTKTPIIVGTAVSDQKMDDRE